MVVGKNKKHSPNHGLMVISDYLLWSRVKNHLKQKCMNKSQIYNHMGMFLNEATLITHWFPRKKNQPLSGGKNWVVLIGVSLKTC